MPRIRLSSTELMVAAYLGSARTVRCWQRDATHAYGLSPADTWTPNIEGMAGELAAAKLLGVYWLPRIDTDHYNGDVAGRYEVRTNASRKWDDTVLHPDDFDDRPYIGVLSFAPEFEIMGWIMGADGKQPQWWRDGAPGRPAFWVPRSALRPMDELPA